MRIVFWIILTFFFLPCFFLAQNPDCPSPFIYMDGGTHIKAYDPGQPLSSTNPATTTIPAFGTGLALMPSINGGTLCPTFYSTSGGNYYYWDGVNWVNTGHSTGNANAVNMAGCGSFIFNLVGSTGQVYVYDGQNNGSLLTTISSFSTGGPYDLVADCDCNFYVLRTATTSPGQAMYKYSSSGALLATYALSNMPHATSGTGFAIVGNNVYLRNSVGSGFFVGTISGNVINFTSVNGFNASVGDFASCPSCTNVPSNNYNPQISGGMITCSNPSVTISVSSSIAPSSYTWAGPGLIGSSTGSAVGVKASGNYTCVVKYQGCPSSYVTLTTAVTTNTTVVTATIAPLGYLCVTSNSTTKLAVAHSSTNEVVSWLGAGSPVLGDTLEISAPGTYTARVVNPANGCEAQDTVHVILTPTLQVSLSSNTICAHPFNGSPATLTLSPSGASNYTLLTSPNFTTPAPNGPMIPVTMLNGNISTATGTVIGANGMCITSATFVFAIVQNPVVMVPPAAVCPGQTHQFNASGALSYSWAGPALDTYTGSAVTSSASSTSVYSVSGQSGSCFSAVHTTTLTILPLPNVSITPVSSTICLGATTVLGAVGTATSFAWSGNSGLSGSSGAQVSVTPPFSQVYTIIGSLNGCSRISQATVHVVAPPTMSLSLSTNSMCFSSFNNSNGTIHVSPAGAQQYTLYPGAQFTITQPNGPVMSLTSWGPPPAGPVVATMQLVGRTGVCTVTRTQTFTIIPNPIIGISPPSTSICPGQEQVFTLSGASGFTWAASASLNTLTPNTAVAKPSQTSFYSVTGHSLGCYSETKNAIVVVLPAPQISVTPKTATLCAGQSIQLTAKGDADSFHWLPAQEVFPNAGITVTVSPMFARSFTVVATLNTCTTGAVATVSAIPMPEISAFASEPVICSSSSTMLKASGAAAFNWAPTEHLSSSSGNQVFASPPSSTRYTVWGFNGTCSGSASVLVETVKRPDLFISSADGQNVLCYGNGLLVTTTGAMNYQWSPSAWVYPVSSNTLVQLQPPVSSNFTVVASNNRGSVHCYQQQSFSVTVMPQINPQVSKSSVICAGEKITLVASGGNSYKWFPRTGLNLDNSNRVVAVPAVTTIYTVEISYHTYCARTATVLVEVKPLPSVNAGRDSAYHISDAIYLNGTGTGSFSWISGDGILCHDCATTQVLPSRSGCYIAQVLNEFGCAATDEVCLDISEEFTFYIPNTFTPNNDGLNDVFKVYGENFSNLSMEVYDRWGQLIFVSTDESKGWDGRFKGEKCKPDIYVYRIHYTGLDRKKYNVNGHITLAK